MEIVHLAAGLTGSMLLALSLVLQRVALARASALRRRAAASSLTARARSVYNSTAYT
jgi:hypothetical protein